MLSSNVASGFSCLGFILGMGWLITQVATPLAEQPTPLVIRDEDRIVVAPRGAEVDRFVHSTPMESSRELEMEDALVLTAVKAVGGRGGVGLPSPVIDRSAPVIVDLDTRLDEMAPLLAEGDSTSTEWLAPEAVVVEARPGRGLGLLAALTPAEDAAVATLAEQAAPERAPVEYKVERGDSLARIARRFLGTSSPEALAALATANPKIAKRRDKIFVGEVLRIPEFPASERPAALVKAETRKPRAAEAFVEAKPTEAKLRGYTVRRGDSLAGIARRLLNDVERWREIAALNDLRDAHVIVPGERILLPPVRNDT